MFSKYERKLKKREYEYHSNNLCNFKTVLKDTRGKVAKCYAHSYNCMSYALGIFNDWLELEEWRPYYDEGSIFELEEMAFDCALELEENWGCRCISSPKDTLLKGERVIAMRIGFDDFHFARLNSDGLWTHKKGSGHIYNMSEEELYSEAWCTDRFYPYVSKVYFFAVNERKVG